MPTDFELGDCLPLPIGIATRPDNESLATPRMPVDATVYFAFAVAVTPGPVSSLYIAAPFTAAVGLAALGSRRPPDLLDLRRLFVVGAVQNFGYRRTTSCRQRRGLSSVLRCVSTWGATQWQGLDAEAEEQ